MVNVKNLFGMAVMASALVACSSNDDVNPSGNQQESAGTAYATFQINLPTVNGTRADEPDGEPTFARGEEYKVNDATLFLFEKDGSDYKFKESVDLGSMEPWTPTDPADGGISTTAKITAKLTKASVGTNGNYYALIILNNSGSKIKTPNFDETYSTWSANADNANATAYLNTKNGFVMANAPKFVDKGEPETLVKIAGVYATEKEATNNAATTIYVERGLAKVSLASGSENKHLEITAGNYKDDVVDIKGWALDVTNTKTFPVHVTAGLATDFTGIWNSTTTAGQKYGAKINRFWDEKLSEFPRVYWGVDPNYNKDFSTVQDCAKEFNMITKNDIKLSESDAKEPQYCLENTFDINHMMQGQSTRVLFAAKYTPKGFSENETFYKMGNSVALWNADKVTAQIKAMTQEVLNESDASKVTVTLNASGNDLTKAGTHFVTAANVSWTGGDISTEQIKNINTKLGFNETNGVGLGTYENGISYYIARVKHFNELTPWKAGDDTYNSSNIDWLGRYGVLRNNWYELSVNSVSAPGYPDVPKVNPTDPDDENNQYISVSVKILDWAKRAYSVDL